MGPTGECEMIEDRTELPQGMGSGSVYRLLSKMFDVLFSKKFNIKNTNVKDIFRLTIVET